jgi:hypothetical protein
MLYYIIIYIIIFILILIYYNYKFIGYIELFKNKKELKIACITSIYGEYDNLKTPNINGLEYIDWYCFTDNNNIKSNIWKIINRPYHIENMKKEFNNYKNHYNNISDINILNMMSAKYYKIMTHEIDILKKYDYYIWIDGSIFLRPTFLNNIIEIINQDNINLINFKHSVRDNVRDEVITSIEMDKYKNQEIIKQYNEYLEKGFLDKRGLYENTVIIRRNNKIINNLFNKWWIHNLKYSYQDQISYPYILSKYNLNPDYIINENVFNNDNYTYSDYTLMKKHWVI